MDQAQVPAEAVVAEFEGLAGQERQAAGLAVRWQRLRAGLAGNQGGQELVAEQPVSLAVVGRHGGRLNPGGGVAWQVTAAAGCRR